MEADRTNTLSVSFFFFFFFFRKDTTLLSPRRNDLSAYLFICSWRHDASCFLTRDPPQPAIVVADFRSRDRDAQCRSYLLRVSLGCVRIERFLLQQNAGSQRTSLVITWRSGRCPRESLKRWLVAPRPRPSRDYEWKRSYDLFTLFAVWTTKWSVRERTHALPTFRARKKRKVSQRAVVKRG